MATSTHHPTVTPINIEIEQKFLCPDDIEMRLEQLGARKMASQSFTDCYHDTADCVLTLADHWLRTRDGVWQLKSPPPKHLASSTTAQYLETESPAHIYQAVLRVLTQHTAPAPGPPPPPSCNARERFDLHELLRQRGVAVFAQFRTERQQFTLPDQRLLVMLDKADFGYTVGEVEQVVQRQEDAAKALEDVDDLIRKLGVVSERRVAGKMEAYLARRNPTHLQLLLQKGIMGEVGKQQ